MSREIIMGIDVGTSAVKTVILGQKDKEPVPCVIGTGISPSNGLRKGFIIDPAETAISIKDSVKTAREAAGINIKDAFVSFAGIGLSGIKSKGSIVVSRADREITENDSKRAVAQSETQLNRNASPHLLNRDILHRFPLSFKIDGEAVLGEPTGMKGEKLEAETFFITAQTQHLNNLIKSMDIAGIGIEDVVAAPLASAKALLTRQEREVGSLIINIGGDTSSVAVFEEGNPISLEVFPIGSNHVTYDIARGFQVPLSEAEELKLSYGREESSLRKKLANIIEPRLNDVFELVEAHLKKIGRSRLLPAGAILTGGGANLINIEEIAKKALAIPVQMGRPKTLEDSKNPTDNPVWSVAFGLCIMDIGEKFPAINLPKRTGVSIKKTVARFFKNLLP